MDYGGLRGYETGMPGSEVTRRDNGGVKGNIFYHRLSTVSHQCLCALCVYQRSWLSNVSPDFTASALVLLLLKPTKSREIRDRVP